MNSSRSDTCFGFDGQAHYLFAPLHPELRHLTLWGTPVLLTVTGEVEVDCRDCNHAREI